MPPSLLYPILSFVPMSLLAAVVWTSRWLQDSKALSRQPNDRTLRSPGESTRRLVEDYNRLIADSLIWVLGFPIALVVWYLTAKWPVLSSASRYWTFIVAGCAWVFGLSVLRLIPLLRKYNQQRRALLAEQTVGGQLDKLAEEGCFVFHDYPLADNSNIDHVVVTRGGLVYAIDTKISGQGGAPWLQRVPTVVYDGTGLQFPDHYETDLISQTGLEAQRLGALLTSEVGLSIAVQPLVALPGCNVSSKAPGKVAMLDTQKLKASIWTDVAAVLPPDEIAQVVYQLDRHCRKAAA